MKQKINTHKLTRLALAGIAAGALSFTACKKPTSSDNNEGKDEVALAKFMADCEAKGGTVENHDCQGMNTCAGDSFQLGVGISTHDCQGHSTCKGASCVGAM